MFPGPQAYITPSWYPGKAKHGMAALTRHYSIVVVHGGPEFIHDSAWLHNHLTALTIKHEAAQVVPWKIGGCP